MAFIHDWNRAVPSGDSLISLGDDLLRSDKSILEETLNTEHYFTATSASSRSAGEHKTGSARVGIGTASALSNPAPGRINYLSDITDFAVALSRSSFSRLGIATVGKRNIFSVAQIFDSGLSVGSPITFGADVNLYRQAANVLRTDDALWASSLSAADAVRVGGDLTVVGSIVGTLDMEEVSSSSLSVTKALEVGTSGDIISAIIRSEVTFPAVTVAASGASNFFRRASGVTQGDAIFLMVGSSLPTNGFVTLRTVTGDDNIMINVRNHGSAPVSFSSTTLQLLTFKP
jgi:hypothetical protein